MNIDFLDESNIPLQIRLKRGNSYIVGSDKEWEPVQSLNTVLDTYTINPSRSDDYTLEWQWPLEANKDSNDTDYANLEAKSDLELTITTTATLATSAEVMDDNGRLLYRAILNPAQYVTLVADILVALVLIILLYIRRGIYVTGFVSGTKNIDFKCGKRKDKIREGGRFFFKKIRPGKRTFEISDDSVRWELKRKKGVDGIEFSGRTIYIDKKNSPD